MLVGKNTSVKTELISLLLDFTAGLSCGFLLQSTVQSYRIFLIDGDDIDDDDDDGNILLIFLFDKLNTIFSHFLNGVSLSVSLSLQNGVKKRTIYEKQVKMTKQTTTEHTKRRTQNKYISE